MGQRPLASDLTVSETFYTCSLETGVTKRLGLGEGSEAGVGQVGMNFRQRLASG